MSTLSITLLEKKDVATVLSSDAEPESLVSLKEICVQIPVALVNEPEPCEGGQESTEHLEHLPGVEPKSTGNFF